MSRKPALVILGGLASVVALAGCELLSPEGGHKDSPSGVIVANQGNFSDGNGSITLYDPDDGAVGRIEVDFGSILQSVAVMDGRLFVTANSADRIDVFDMKTWTRVGRIDGVRSPRYFAQVSPGKAYVTNIFKTGYTGGSVTVLDLIELSVSGQVDVGDNPDGIAIHGGFAFVANHGFGAGNTLSVLDTATDEVVRTVAVACDGPRFVEVDAQDELWVFCTGKELYDENFTPIGHTDGRVLILSLSGEEVGRFEFSGALGTIGPGQDVAFSEERSLAFVAGGGTIHAFDTSANARGVTFTPAGEAAIGAVAYDAVQDRIYLGRVPGFVTAGFVTIHARSGEEQGRFGSGVAPAFIAFIR